MKRLSSKSQKYIEGGWLLVRIERFYRKRFLPRQKERKFENEINIKNIYE